MGKIMLGIDPSNIHSAYCTIDEKTKKPLQFGKVPNEQLRQMLRDREIKFDEVVIEDIQNMGLPAGRTLFDTAKEIGRQTEILEGLGYEIEYVYRREEKIHICGTMKANDATIRRALIDRFAETESGKGTKRSPDFFYGFHSDIWQSFCVALTAVERREE